MSREHYHIFEHPCHSLARMRVARQVTELPGQPPDKEWILVECDGRGVLVYNGLRETLSVNARSFKDVENGLIKGGWIVIAKKDL